MSRACDDWEVGATSWGFVVGEYDGCYILVRPTDEMLNILQTYQESRLLNLQAESLEHRLLINLSISVCINRTIC